MPKVKMNKGTKIIILLLFLSPALGELLSGSTPPLQFFNPVSLFFLYSCMAAEHCLLEKQKQDGNYSGALSFWPLHIALLKGVYWCSPSSILAGSIITIRDVFRNSMAMDNYAHSLPHNNKHPDSHRNCRITMARI